MRRITSPRIVLFLTVVFILVSFAAKAEYEYEPHTAYCGLYSFELPAGSSALSGETIAAIVGEDALLGQLTPSDRESFSELSLSRVEFVSGPGFHGFFLTNVDTDVPAENSPAAILEIIASSYDEISAALGDHAPTVTFIDNTALGDHLWCGLEIATPGSLVHYYLTADATGNVYSFIFYDVPSDVITHILETFSFLS